MPTKTEPKGKLCHKALHCRECGEKPRVTSREHARTGTRYERRVFTMECECGTFDMCPGPLWCAIEQWNDEHGLYVPSHRRLKG